MEFVPLTKEQRENIRAWIAALRSGNYTQGHGLLKQITPELKIKYCCLGVLEDVVEGQKMVGFARSCLTPGTYRDYIGVFAESIAQDELIILNDTKRLSFNEIANCIENRYRECFL